MSMSTVISLQRYYHEYVYEILHCIPTILLKMAKPVRGPIHPAEYE